MRSGTGRPGLALALALVVVAAGCGTSSGSDGASDSTTTRPATATTGAPAGDAGDDEASDDEAFDDAEAMGGLVGQYQPGFELMFDDTTTTCVTGVFTEASLGDLSDDAVMSQYEGCGVTGQEVTGALIAAQLLGKGVSEGKARCIGEAVGELDPDELDAMSDADGRALADGCGVDWDSLGS